MARLANIRLNVQARRSHETLLGKRPTGSLRKANAWWKVHFARGIYTSIENNNS
jgi:hypothetical protein